MGAEHKLDLTSDTTHLIVGSTDTAKYQYVAREREDIKVLRPEWVEAVRELWINDSPLNLDALARDYRMPTMAGLKICITGFDDLSFRAQLQRNVIENGGQYTGDLTKDVTHLIAAKPEGKKYEYGMSWQKKVVSLKWYKDTLERGMQLDEKLYHPTLQVAEQGVGAWNRQPQRSPRPIKRARGEDIAPEPSRKLRRIASARLGSQTQNMWTDIVGGAGFEADPVDRPQLKPSTSMPSLRQDEASKQHAGSGGSTSATGEGQEKSGFLAGQYFVLRGFDERKDGIVRHIIQGKQGTVIDAEELDTLAPSDTLLMLPHDLRKKGRDGDPNIIIPGLRAVSELWLERCMLENKFIDPDKYPLGLFPGPCSTVLSSVLINVSGFLGLETLHISKMVSALGGKYTEKFAAGVSVLVVRKGSHNAQKLAGAQEWGIPVVSEEWLWSTIKSGKQAPFASYLLLPTRAQKASAEEQTRQKRKDPDAYVEVGTVPLRPEEKERQARSRSKSYQAEKDVQNKPRSALKSKDAPVRIHRDATDDAVRKAEETMLALDDEDTLGRSESERTSFVQEDLPLQELSSNSSGKNHSNVELKRIVMPPLDGTVNIQETKRDENVQTSGAQNDKSSGIQALNGAIRDFLDSGIRKRPIDDGEKPVKKGRLFGRALSNLSNGSASSHPRQSRASSIDSMNTDGVGSEIAPAVPFERPALGGASSTTSTGEKGTFNFTGKAKTTMTGGGITPLLLSMHDLDMPDHNSLHRREEETPRMTQLGYEDPEEAVLLREKLAASRRRKSKLGQNEDDPKPPAAVRANKPERKLRDDDILSGAGWGAGRRTRHKQKSPPDQGIKDF
ncbi:protein kinase activating protein dpb11 [Exophiala xenobiotica]|nr:protein kinase activating protein dpb11 [Exophiala xenobiotica]KAK5385940.1 protein kinase activating protein dpb11 [Exophiala xenobiotica]KAK5394279.1 protein kinase activating protein dpb11 [Exophiala xenobiotica]KAK5413854.1 protein kinase activating protein dpb11 [Exophiala xenobiotica]KAK5422146.1 protein kinase activating protein dpb11 [Exophiala xenobiotica]